MYIAYFTFCCDIELACDERVISDMEKGERRLYSTALLSCSTEGKAKVPGICPVAFGEVGVKERIVRIMKYTKPSVLSKILTVMLGVVLTASLVILPMGYNLFENENMKTEIDTDIPAGYANLVNQPLDEQLSLCDNDIRWYTFCLDDS